MTVEEIKAMFAETAAQMRETDRRIDNTFKRMSEEMDSTFKRMSEEIDRVSKRTSEQIDRVSEEIDRVSKRTSEQIDKVSKKILDVDEQIDKVSKQMGGINENIGHHAEQFFQNVFTDSKVFGGIKYDEIIPNMKHGKDIEFDIFLENCNSVAIIEVKNRIHPGFVKKLAQERFGKFRKYFPEYKDCDVYMGIAGFSFSEKVLSEAQKYGIGIIRQAGEGVEVRTEGLKAYR